MREHPQHRFQSLSFVSWLMWLSLLQAWKVGRAVKWRQYARFRQRRRYRRTSRLHNVPVLGVEENTVQFLGQPTDQGLKLNGLNTKIDPDLKLRSRVLVESDVDTTTLLRSKSEHVSNHQSGRTKIL